MAEFKRTAYFKVKEVLDNYRIPILVGLRRTGKTTILNQLSSEYEKSQIIKFDSFAIKKLTTEELYFYVCELIVNGAKVLLFDEVQARGDWDLLIKNIYDDYMAKKAIKLAITGSSSLSFVAKDTGVTRTQKILITTLAFNEYLAFAQKQKTQVNFENFLGRGAFPEHVRSRLSYEQMMAQSLEPILNDDIPSHYKISSGNITRLLSEIAHLTNNEFNVLKSSQNTGIKRKQINTYLDILEKCQIIKRIYKVNQAGDYPRYRTFKVYINPHFQLWILNKKFKDLDQKYVGSVIESYWLYAETQIDGYYKKFVYIKDANTSEEVDFASFGSLPKFKTLHELKYSKDNVNINKLFLTTKSNNKVIWYLGPSRKDGFIKYENILDFK